MHRHLRTALWLTPTVLVLLAVLMLYLRADFMVSVAEQLWSCF